MKPSVQQFEEILKSDGYSYVVKSKDTEDIDIDFPNLPDWHKEGFEEWRQDEFGKVDVISFDHKDSNYKLLLNGGIPDCNDGYFGVVFDENNDKLLDILSTGDMETTLQSLKTDDTKLDDAFSKKLSPYLECFSIMFENKTEFEFLVFKIMHDEFLRNCSYDMEDYLEENYEDGDDDADAEDAKDAKDDKNDKNDKDDKDAEDAQ